MPKLPKPLSEKSIQKMLEGWDMNVVGLIRKTYTSLINLYGVLPLWLAWDVAKACGIKIKKKDFYAYSDIARREVQPYYIFDEDELFDLGSKKTECRFFVSKAVLIQPFNNFDYMYEICSSQAEKLIPYLPDNLFDFSDGDGIEINPAWKRLCMFIKALKTMDGVPLSEPDKSDLPLELSRAYKAEFRRVRTENYYRRPAADRILEDIKLTMHGGGNPVRAFADIAFDCNVDISKKQAERLLELLQETNNTSNLWINFGHKPVDLLASGMANEKKTIKLSELPPIILEAIKNHAIDFNRVRDELAKNGITLTDD